MLEIIVPSAELWDERKQEFIYFAGQTLKLEHSLVSVSKWESKWCKPFLSKNEKSSDEVIDYVRCMTLNDSVDSNTYLCLTNDNLQAIYEYITAPMTATWFFEDNVGSKNKEQITSELIYYWMFTLNIPMSCENWHLTRLLTQIRLCEVKNQPAKKMSRQEVISRNAALNAQRRKQLKSKG